MKKLILFIFVFLSFKTFAQEYLDTTASINERVEDLLSKMTLAEKIGQMTQADNNAVSDMDDVKNYFLGSILSGGGSDPASGNSPLNWADLYDSFQTKALQTRLAIPIIYGIDAIHGHSNVEGAVIFPHNIGLGATRNADLVEEYARITAIEVAATGIDWTFEPCVTVPRNERWGRTYEGFSENTELVTELGAAAVIGFQGDTLNSPASIAACSKHYIGDGGTTDGDDQGNTEITEEELREIHLPPYVSSIENDVKTIMASYNSWNGNKLHGSKYLLTDVLKTELGFEGFIVSDWAAIDQIPGDYKSDIEASINAGIDMVMVPNNYKDFINLLIELVNENKVSMDRIDDAVRRILKVKFELGLFERPLADRSLLAKVGSAEHRAVAKQAVTESQVLLKKNNGVLPLPKSGIKVLVAGQHADDIGLQCGGWTIQWGGSPGEITEGTTILEGLEKIAPNVEFVYDESGNFSNDDSDADYIIAAVGEQPYAEGNGDRETLELDRSQILMINRLKELGKPLITLIISGRPMITNTIIHNSDVVFASWLPGTEGDGIAELIFGNSTPTGLLPFTWQKSNEDIPQNYGDDNYDPLYPYGFGITSYDDSPSGEAPVFNSGMLIDSGNKIELAFNKPINIDGNSNAVFSVKRNGSENINVTSFSLKETDAKRIIIDLASEADKNDIISVSYLSGNLDSEDGGTVQLFNDAEVINFLAFMPQQVEIPAKIEAEDFFNMSGIQTETTSDAGGGLNVGWIDAGDWLEYYITSPVTGNYKVTFRIASETQSGILSLNLGDSSLTSSLLPITGGWQKWVNVSSNIDLEKGTYFLRLNVEQGGFNLNWISFDLLTDIKEEKLDLNFNLEQNYPNPFNPSTKIQFSIPGLKNQSQLAELAVFDVLGKKVETIVNGRLLPGTYEYKFNAEDYASGIYFYRLTYGTKSEVKSMMLLK